MDRFNAFILFLICCYGVIFSVISVNRYWQYEAHYLDFGIYDEAIWKVAHFRAPIVDKGENGLHIFADHFVPGLFLLSPFYWFTDKQEIMFIAQVVIVCLSAWVAFKIAKSRFDNKVIITALIVAYLGFVGMQNALITELHVDVFGILPLMLVFWSIERYRWKYYFLFTFLLLSFKENNAGLVAGIGLYLILRYGKTYAWYAIATMVIGVLWGIITITIIIPSFNNGVYAYAPNHLHGQSIPMIISRFSDEKIKRDTVFYTFSTYGFLPLFDFSVWPILFEHYLERFVMSNDRTRFDLGFHYNAIIVPVLFMASLNILEKLQKRVPKKIISILSAGIIGWVLFFSRFMYHGPIDLFYNRTFYEQKKNLSYIDDFVKIFPKKGLVLTQNNLAPRLTHGTDVRIIRSNFVSLHPDYVILDLTPGQRFVGTDELAMEIKDYYLANDRYTVTKVHDHQYLFKKN